MRFILGITILLAGCRNECQQLCLDMADYAESDCKKPFPDNQVKACQDKYASAVEQTLDACETYRPTLKEEWTCDDIKQYFD